MNTNELHTYQFPEHLVTRFQKLMNSKESFLESLSDADRRKLQTLYERLQSAWKQNRTEELKERSMTLSHNLKMQESNLTQDNLKFEEQSSNACVLSLNLKKLRLQEAEQICLRKVSELTASIQAWKNDIKQSENELLQSESIFERERIKNDVIMGSLIISERQKYETTLNGKREKLTQASQNRNEALQLYKSERRTLQSTFDKKKSVSDSNLIELERSLKTLKHDMRKHFGKKIASQIPNCSTELQELLTSGDWGSISLKVGRQAADLAGLEKALSREASSHGIKLDEFLKQFDAYENAAPF